MKNLKDKIAVITGGNSGIGYAAAKKLKENGADMIHYLPSENAGFLTGANFLVDGGQSI
ncbi:SDR family NAD(P)-dependent oxidoreductase [Sphingobacterium siyangense]|uniref:SDR family NAD(P)-dependent oxidoreductase n=1 Tax=Sphingobacterium siyangense TaxID=459529 RepID=UPI003C756CE2